MKRRLAVAAVSAAAAGYLVRSEAQRRLRRHRDRKRIGELLRQELKAGAWMLEGVSLAVARLSPGEVPVSVSVVTRGADGISRAYVIRPGGTGPVVTVRRADRA